ncbi:PREDICTED: olfactory receptor 5A1-like [Elephantulus edwardii]|uniref:olfactory receptor 5A1-like n=1 Tax=Elephantulus edwardii TaxID=28737 RepID=UPI0003F0BAA9|nr:PREDICTED: olfactory receptor 5A1-like [Elephantulus edwardii]
MASSKSMEWNGNHSSVTMFILLGLSDDKELQLILFPILSGIYILTLTWNLGLIFLIRMDPHLHIPMYFFLSVLSFIDVSFSSSISPRMLADFFQDEKTISFLDCAVQYFIFTWMGISECCLMAVMAIDRYAAIGKPLQYSVIMSPGVCGRMVAGVYTTAFLSSLAQTISCFSLYYCGPNVIQHFFCDFPQIIPLSCSDSFISETILLLAAIFFVFGSFLVTLLSYGFIAVSILNMSSGKASAKAFNTCASHLTAVTLFFSTVLSVYMRPNSSTVTKQDKVLSVFYAIVIPMLNPLIYSLRNKEIKAAIKRAIKKAKC